jgi:hypothetical protein
MAISAVRLALVFCLAGSFCSGFCQTNNSELPEQKAPPDPAKYEAFFQQVSQLKFASESLHFVTANGDVERVPGVEVPLTVPKIQDVIGLNDAEVEALNTYVADSLAKIDSLQSAAGPLIFESRLQFAESGKVSEAVTRELRDLDYLHKQIVLEHVQQLKASLPDSSFEKLDAYVRAPSGDGKLLSPTLAPRPSSQAIPK